MKILLTLPTVVTDNLGWSIFLAFCTLLIIVSAIKEFVSFEHFRCKAIMKNGSMVYGTARRHKKKNTYEFHESGRKYNLLSEEQSKEVEQSRRRLTFVAKHRKLKEYEVPRFNM